MRCPRPVPRSMVAACVILAAGSARAADPALIEAAKKESEVTWYTTQIISQLVRPVSAAFEKKYGIKVRSTRANSTELSVKIINEKPGGQAAIGRVRRHLDGCAAQEGRLRAAMAAGSGQVLSGAVQGPGGLLGREQPVLPHPRFQHRACFQGNGAAQLPGAARPEMARQDRRGAHFPGGVAGSAAGAGRLGA